MMRMERVFRPATRASKDATVRRRGTTWKEGPKECKPDHWREERFATSAQDGPASVDDRSRSRRRDRSVRLVLQISVVLDDGPLPF